jgi:hypothetical protein
MVKFKSRVVSSLCTIQHPKNEWQICMGHLSWTMLCSTKATAAFFTIKSSIVMASSYVEKTRILSRMHVKHYLE